MNDRPVIHRIVWDEWNIDHIRKHDVTQKEAEEIITGDSILQASYKGRFVAIGPTNRGRMLAVVIGPTPGEPGAFYVFSARPASRRERAEFEASRGGR